MATYEYPRPICSVDVALFTVSDRKAHRSPGEPERFEKRVSVALIERAEPPEAGRLALPGTHLRTGEDQDLEAAAARALKDKCGLGGLFVEQLRTYSGRGRDARDWSTTTAYFALVPPHRIGSAAKGMVVADAEAPGDLPFDHGAIVADGLARIRSKAGYSTLPALLLADEFTWRELEDAYEGVLGRKVHTAGFRRKLRRPQGALRGARGLLPRRDRAQDQRQRQPAGGPVQPRHGPARQLPRPF